MGPAGVRPQLTSPQVAYGDLSSLQAHPGGLWLLKEAGAWAGYLGSDFILLLWDCPVLSKKNGLGLLTQECRACLTTPKKEGAGLLSQL